MAVFNSNEWTRVAQHEAGHAVLHASIFKQFLSTSVSISPTGERQGHHAAKPPVFVRTADELAAWTMVIGGGAAAEINRFGSVSAGVTGDKAKLNKMLELNASRIDVSGASDEVSNDFPEARKRLTELATLLDDVAAAMLTGIQRVVESDCDLAARHCVLSEAELQAICIDHAAREDKSRLDRLLADSEVFTGGQTANLMACRGRGIVVHRVRAGVIAEVVCHGGANGVVIRDGDVYHIFFDENGDPRGANCLGIEWGIRYIVLHEYGHVLHGDAIQDQVEEGRIVLAYLPLAEVGLIEACAHGYAYERLAREAELAGQAGVAATIFAVKAQNGAVGPSDPDYQVRYPFLEDEPKSW